LASTLDDDGDQRQVHGVTLKIIITTVFPVQFTCVAFYVKRTYGTISWRFKLCAAFSYSTV